MDKIVCFFLIVLIVFGCKPKTGSRTISEEELSRPKGSYQRNIKGIVSIETFDHYNRPLKQGYGFYISSKALVTNLDLIKGSYKAKVAPVGTEEYFDIAGFTAYDLEENLVILKTWKENLNYLNLDKSIKNIPDSVAGLYRKRKKIYAPKTKVLKNKMIL